MFILLTSSLLTSINCFINFYNFGVAAWELSWCLWATEPASCAHLCQTKVRGKSWASVDSILNSAEVPKCSKASVSLICKFGICIGYAKSFEKFVRTLLEHLEQWSKSPGISWLFESLAILSGCLIDLLDLIGRSPKNNTDWIRLERFYFEPVPSGCLSLSMVIQESISVNSSTLVKRIF